MNTHTTHTKTIVLAGNLAGGQYKSTTIGTVANSLQSLGHSTKLIAMDCFGNPTLKRLFPEIAHFDPRDQEAYGQALTEAINANEDIVIIDCSGSDATPLFQAAQAVAEKGIRFVVGIITQKSNEHSMKGGCLFAIYAAKHLAAEYILITIKDEPKEQEPEELESEKILSELADGRVIEVPTFTQRMREQFEAKPAVLTKYMEELNLFERAPWEHHLQRVTQSVAQHAEWLAGKPIPKQETPKTKSMTTIPDPQTLTAEYPIAAYESATPLLLKILPAQCGSSDLVRNIVWSCYNGHPVSLSRLSTLDQDRKDAVLAVINLRMDAHSGSTELLKTLLEESGEFARREETLELAKKHGLYQFDYPLSDDQWSILMEKVNAANGPDTD